MMFAAIALAAALQAPAAQSPATPPPSPSPQKPFDCSAPEHRQFDFWVGVWDVVPNPATRPANAPPPNANRKPATNVIEKAHSGCVIVENWDDGIGGTGQSFNLYDRVKQRWQQTWVDNTGGLHEYWGGLKDGSMVYVGEVPTGPGQPFAGKRILRVTFTPMGPDRMRQFSESLRSDGTWTPNYDLIYTRRAKEK
jgi:hypothetical protein